MAQSNVQMIERKEQTKIPMRTQVLQKARELFRKEGYERTSMKDIASACDCNPANIYNYFDSKERLLYEIMHEEAKNIVSAMIHLENDDTTSPVEQLRYIISTHVHLVLSSDMSSGLFDTEFKSLTDGNRKQIIKLRDTYSKILGKVIARGVATGDFAQVDEKLAVIIISSILVRLRIWFSKDGRLNPNQIADSIFHFVFNSLAARRD